MTPDLMAMRDADLLRLLTAAEAEARTRRLVPDEKRAGTSPAPVIGREET